MKILILHNKLPYPPKDGGSIAVLEFARELANQHHEVTLLCMNTKKHFFPPDQLPDDIKQSLNLIAVNVDASICPTSLVWNFLFSSKPYHQVRFSSKDFKKALINMLYEKRFDFVLFDGLFVLPYIDVVKKYSKVYTVYRAHNIESEIWSRMAKNERHLIKKWYLSSLSKRLHRLEKKLINSVDLVLTLTQRDQLALKKMGCRTLMFVSNAGIPMKQHKPNHSLTTFPSVFFIGALDWLPNQEGLLWFLRSIWPKLSITFPEVKFEIAGRNAPQWLKNKIQEYKNVVFHGEIEDSSDFIKRRSIMVVPLFSGSGIRIKIIEGMALGKAIVTTSIGVEGIPALHASHLMIADTDNDFYRAVATLINNQKLTEMMGSNAFEFVNQYFNIQNIVKDTVDFIDKAKSL